MLGGGLWRRRCGVKARPGEQRRDVQTGDRRQTGFGAGSPTRHKWIQPRSVRGRQLADEDGDGGGRRRRGDEARRGAASVLCSQAEEKESEVVRE